MYVKSNILVTTYFRYFYCFFNFLFKHSQHDCVDPNLFVQMVYVESDERFPCIAFFTRTFIKAGKELRFNYNATNINPENRKKCKCRSNCKAYLF